MRSSDEGDEAERYVGPHDIVRVLGMSPRTVRRWVDNGWLNDVITHGGHYRLRQEDVKALAEQVKRQKDVRD